LTLARSSPAASIGYRVFVSRAIVGANGLFVAREIDGGAVDLIGLFELHAARCTTRRCA
jgi:hypothetical protein